MSNSYSLMNSPVSYCGNTPWRDAIIEQSVRNRILKEQAELEELWGPCNPLDPRGPLDPLDEPILI